MKALLGIGHTASGQKGTLDKGLTAAGLLQNAEIDVVGDGPAGVSAEALEDPGDFLRIENAEAALSQSIFRWELIEAEGKGFFEQPGKPLGKGGGSCDDPDLRGAKGVAVKQDPVALGQRQISLFKTAVAEFCFGFGGEGHGGLLTCRYPG